MFYSIAFGHLCIVTIIIQSSARGPNFIIVLTDDQDLVLDSMSAMPKTRRLLQAHGVTFTNAFVNTPICCPSRSTILTGRMPHNLGVYNNSIEGGCASLTWQHRHESNNTLATRLKDNRYATFYGGKYLNQYGSLKAGGLGHVPAGWDWWAGLKGNSRYYNYTLSINGTARYFDNVYLTDHLGDLAVDFLNRNYPREFLMVLAPPAPHSPFVPAPRHRHLFPEVEAVRRVPFNTTPTNKHWLVGMPPRNLPCDVTRLDHIHRNRLRTLVAVDELVDLLMHTLEQFNITNDTHVVYTSDNGFHIGQFGQPWDKRQPYQSDLRVPLIVRGPGSKGGAKCSYPVSAVDLVPTVLVLAGVSFGPDDFDGASFAPMLRRCDGEAGRVMGVEYWGEGNAESVDPSCPWGPESDLAECPKEAWCKCQDARNNTYNCIIDLAPPDRVKVCVFSGDFVEIYNLTSDPFELDNLYANNGSRYQPYLDTLRQMRTCKGHRECSPDKNY